MSNEIFINGIEKSMVTIARMILVRDKSGNPDKDTIAVYYANGTHESVLCTPKNMLSFAMWQTLTIVEQQIQIDTLRQKVELLRGDVAQAKKKARTTP